MIRWPWIVMCVAWLLLAGCDPRTEAVEAETASEPEAAAAESEPAVLVTVRRAVARADDRSGAEPGAGAGLPVEWVPGTVVSRHDAAVAAEVAGRLVSVGEVGDRLAAGDVVARVDDTALKLRLRSDEAEIRRLEAQLDYLDRQLARVDALTQEQIASRTQLDELTSQRVMAEQALESARVARDTTAFLVERSTLRAPFPGRVVARLAPPGSYVSAGDPVVRLVDTTHVEISAQAPLEAALRVEEGMTVDLRVSGSSSGSVSAVVAGMIRAAVPVGDDRSRMFELRIRTPDGASWPVGTPVRVALPARARAGTSDGAGGGAGVGVGDGAEATVAVPRDALILRREATYVFVVDDVEGVSTAHRIEVTPGVGDGEWIEVAGEVQAGDRVIVRGGERLEHGQRVDVGG